MNGRDTPADMATRLYPVIPHPLIDAPIASRDVEVERLTRELAEMTHMYDIAAEQIGNDRRIATSEEQRLTRELAEARANITKVEAQRDHLKRREQDIVEACERVADGGQYRADIVSAIQRIRRERDEVRATIERLTPLPTHAPGYGHDLHDDAEPGAPTEPAGFAPAR